ncbi:MAG: histidine kinase dimerization/phospho-acceptor domain-containing protein [Erythrobacter sp.]
MLFDDRLATVLRLNATSLSGQRTQLRQLLDLLGSRRQALRRGEGVREQSLIAAAWLRMDALAAAIPAAERAAIIREPGWRFHSAELAHYLAEHEPEVAAAALGRAELSAEDWTALIPHLPIRARGFVRLRRDLPLDVAALLDRLGVHDRGLPAPTGTAPQQPMHPGSEPHEAASHAPPTASRPEPSRLRAVPATSAMLQNPVAQADEVTSAPLGQASSPPDERGERVVTLASSRESSERSEISALVERIAQFRRERSDPAEDPDLSPRLPLGDAPEVPARQAQSFGFVADASGRIEWATHDLAPAVIGTRLLRETGSGMANGADNLVLARAFARRQPLIRAPFRMSGAAAISGDWLVDGTPRFTPEGHFAGYLGRFRRPQSLTAGQDARAAEESDRIRQLLHELRTPITAVQGYAEVIQQQLFGPTPHEYRALAAAIAADAAHILAGFGELDRLARLETGALVMMPGECDCAKLVRQIAGQLEPVLASRSAGFSLEPGGEASLLVAVDEDEVEALLWRVIATLAGSCAAAERIRITLVPVFDGPAAMAQIRCDLPTRLQSEADLFASEVRPNSSAISASLFGAGFALRLARAEARRAGGALEVDETGLTLLLPLITGLETNPKSVVSHSAA